MDAKHEQEKEIAIIALYMTVCSQQLHKLSEKYNSLEIYSLAQRIDEWSKQLNDLC